MYYSSVRDPAVDDVYFVYFDYAMELSTTATESLSTKRWIIKGDGDVDGPE